MRKQRGAITLITLATILLMLAFLISTFTIIMNRRQAQSEVKRKTKEIYESDVGNEEELYNKYFAEESEQTWTETEYKDASEEVKIGTYKGAAETYTITKNGKYLLEVWGANGGTYNSSGKPGTGGYSKGTVELNKNETISLYVGGKGTYGTSTRISDVSGGGCNGGGNAGYRGGAGRRWHRY